MALLLAFPFLLPPCTLPTPMSLMLSLLLMLLPHWRRSWWWRRLLASGLGLRPRPARVWRGLREGTVEYRGSGVREGNRDKRERKTKQERDRREKVRWGERMRPEVGTAATSVQQHRCFLVKRRMLLHCCTNKNTTHSIPELPGLRSPFGPTFSNQNTLV